MNRKHQIVEVRRNIHTTLTDIRSNLQANHHIGQALKQIIAHTHQQPKINKRTLAKLIKETPAYLHTAVEKANDLAFNISRIENHYQALLDLCALDLETHVGLEHRFNQHVESLKQMHQLQKQTLEAVSTSFVSLSRKHLDQLKG